MSELGSLARFYEVIIGIFDYRHMKSRILIQEKDEEYPVQVCSLQALLIVEAI